MINPIHVMLWTYRRQEKDVRHLYKTFRDFMGLVTRGEMLSFGYWKNGCRDPLQAQIALCHKMLKFVELKPNQILLDVGSGKSGPAMLWHNLLSPIKIVCADICGRDHHDLGSNNLNPLEASALNLPLKDNCVDRIIALECAQHFSPLRKFLTDAFRIIKPSGILGLAVPGIKKERLGWGDKKDLGLLNITWPSERHNILALPALLGSIGFHSIEVQYIGKNVYEPLADYYLSHREHIRSVVIPRYSPFVEYIIFKSILAMNKIAQKGIIDYALIKARV
ncbi:MAG: class I SAM-dependent methyltransferase [Nitrososphaerales archaeon]